MTFNLQEILPTRFALTDGKLLFTLLSNYLYRFVSVHLSAFFGHAVSSPLWRKYSTEVQPYTFCRLVMLKPFSGMQQIYPSLWYTHVF